MNRYFVLAIVLLVFSGCSKRADFVENSSSPSPSIPGRQATAVTQPTEDTSAKLTNAKGDAAVTRLISSYRLGGSVSVIGIQELPQENSAAADLRFNNFEYPTTNEGGLIKARDFKPKSMPAARNPGDPLPSMEQMFPPRKRSYSGGGRGLLTHYSDGRWVLKEVRWGQSLDTLAVTGTVTIN